MDLVGLVGRYAVASTVVSIGIGAAVALCIVGVPKLWSQEAAGWASAVASFSAVLAALWLAGTDRRARNADALAQAIGLSVLVLNPLYDWKRNLERLAGHARQHMIDKTRGQAIAESFEPDGGDVLMIPQLVLDNLDRLHLLLGAAAPLGEAVRHALILQRIQYSVLAARSLGNDEQREDFSFFVCVLGQCISALDHATAQITVQLAR